MTIFLTNNETGERLAVTEEQQQALLRDDLPYAQTMRAVIGDARLMPSGITVTSAEFGFVLLTAGYVLLGR